MKGETKQKYVIFSLLIATFLTAIEGTIVSTAMPKIVEDLGGSQLYTWVISVYLLTTVISTPVFGKLADLFGRKMMFVIGVVIFLIGSTLSGFSQSMEQLVIFRAIQGIGAGALTTIPFTIIGDVFTYEQRAKVQGWISSVWGISGIVGPLVGGFIVDTISWHWIFFMNLPFGIVALCLLWVSLHEQIEKKKQTIDYAGIFTFAVSMTAFLYALTLLKEENQVTGSILTLFIVTVAGLGLFIWIEAKGKEPMLPLSLFKIRFITVANIAGFLLGFILVTVTFYIPLWVQGVTNLNATFSGIAMLPMSLTWPFGAVLSGRLLAKTSIGKVSLIGIVIIVAGCLGLVTFQTGTTIPWMMFITAVLGFGFGLALTSFTVAVQSAVDWNMRGAAMGSNNLMRNLGQAIGIAVSGLWLSDELSGKALETSLHTVFIMLVLLALAASLTAAFLLKKKGNELSIQ
ncbi:MDR family MFS transporter [Mesobacillus foraminis]|uniref:EmrB/QacA subfamily drug resistance transporter n=1 Tax=Mesobacillus foraminis TaxID=279826 RepID=A0A4R2B7P4_9BACI|nr:MDR family MFS transporter [Mesobacillus foraminis]TCN22721.1 EmrB/QacA subfamily drug resistance transporter [Mesobacillus foraminis]